MCAAHPRPGVQKSVNARWLLVAGSARGAEPWLALGNLGSGGSGAPGAALFVQAQHPPPSGVWVHAVQEAPV